MEMMKKQLNRIRNKIKPFEVAGVEKRLKKLLKNPLIKVDRLGRTDYYKKIFQINYSSYIVVFEYNEDSDRFVFVSIEQVIF